VTPGTRFELAFFAALLPEDFARIVAGDCTHGFELFPGSTEVKPFSFETSTACESFDQLISNEIPSNFTFQFDMPEAPLRLVAFE